MLNNKNFYPTPPEIAKKMIAKIKLRPSNVLDPSAGKGDLLDTAIKQWWSWSYDNREYSHSYAIEIDENLQHIISNKGHQLLDTDFLKYQGSTQFDCILLNPPFDNGARHLLKAWDILYNGEIVCLLNQETYDNPYTKERQLLKTIIDKYGEIEYLGDCFKDSERVTTVNVIMVYLKKTNQIEKDYFTNLTENENLTQVNSSINDTQIALKNNIGNLVSQYNLAIEKATEGFLKLQEAKYYKSNVVSDALLTGKFSLGNHTESVRTEINTFITTLKKEAWQNVITLTEFKQVMSNKVRKHFESELTKRNHLEFTEDNIKNLLHSLRLDSSNILKNTILEVFDLLTAYHEKNRLYFEGWKTNKSWKVNKRFILPGSVTNSYNGYGLNYYRAGEIEDIDKVFAMLDGKKIPEISVSDVLRHSETKDKKVGESTYFKLKWYLKGTLHFLVKDLKLLKEFNYIACKNRNWLPPNEDTSKKAERLMLNYFKKE